MNRALTLAILLLLPLNALGAVVGKVELFGLKWTKRELVLRELLIKPGQEFSQEKLKLSVRNLLNTHLFYRVKASVTQEGDKVTVKLYLKEKFPIVPLPRVRFKSSGAYKGGLELRDYNFLGMGHKLFTGYTRWFNEEEPSKRAFIYANLYRVIEGKGDLSLGLFYSEGTKKLIEEEKELGAYREKSVSLPVSIKLYLDPKKVNQLSFGLNPHFTVSQTVRDRQIYYLNLSYNRDLTTDMVYYTVGRRFTSSASLAVPRVSSLYTGSLNFQYDRFKRVKGTQTFNYRLSFGTKLGYSGKTFYLKAPIPGCREEKITGKRFLVGSLSYRLPIIDKSVFLKPSLFVGEAFNDSPRRALASAGVEINAFWARLADGIIRFKVFRGLGAYGETESSFKLSFRW
jgi:outer membrane protein assembly factor BamA